VMGRRAANFYIPTEPEAGKVDEERKEGTRMEKTGLTELRAVEALSARPSGRWRRGRGAPGTVGEWPIRVGDVVE